MSLVEKALKASSNKFRHPLFKVQEKQEEETWNMAWHDAPYALMYWDEELLTYRPCWGLGENVSLEEALKDFEYLEEQFKESIKNKIE